MDAGDEGQLVKEWHDLVVRHAVVHQSLERELQARHGIGVSEFEALEALACSENTQCRAQDLTDVVHLSQSAASRLIARMEREGFLERALCEADRRGILVVLTDEGRERHLEAQPTHRSVLARTLRETG
ncbi:MarR family winged helix-turn-helix transcriptional regulator [Streptomyces albiflavescens]|uniref:MarR family winged helix-turn-helix transcriptional regulator n=1 Tax=Streptomyces albiflavescens TaxID=1623582 RepID=UPI00166BF892|nr:MarR family transcriptional regulator [Streptomyces albiflavescens]